MERIYLPIIALAIGFANACLAFQVHSMLFCFLPLFAFALGYFSSWKTGLLSSFLLFISYTSATAFMIGWSDPIFDYLINFVYGGFILCIIGCGAPTVKRGTKSFKSISVLVVLVLLVSWCGYLSFPKYSYTYKVIIESSENLNDLELHLPLGAISQKPYMEIFDHPFLFLHSPTEPVTGIEAEYSLEAVETEYGKMLKLGVPGLKEKFKPVTRFEVPPEPYPYGRNIIFCMSHAPHEKLQFMPKYDLEEVKVIHSERFLGPMRVRGREVVEEFKVPVKVSSDEEAEIKIDLDSLYSRRMAINFTHSKGGSYCETVKLETTTSDEWILAHGEAIRGIGVSAMID